MHRATARCCSRRISPRRHTQIRVLHHNVNQGKGAALHTGFREATGDFVAVRSADPEYDPQDLKRLIGPLLAGQADVVFGSRFLSGGEHRVLYFWHSVGNRVLTLLSNMFTDLNLTDMETCYKIFRRDVLQGIEFHEKRFGFEPEVVAKVARLRLRIYEMGIWSSGQTCRGREEDWRQGRTTGALLHLKYNMPHTPLPIQFAAYLLVGGICAIVNILIFSVLITEASPAVATSLSFVLAAALNYWLCIVLLFRQRARWSRLGELAIYAVVVAVAGAADLTTTLTFLRAGASPIHFVQSGGVLRGAGLHSSAGASSYFRNGVREYGHRQEQRHDQQRWWTSPTVIGMLRRRTTAVMTCVIRSLAVVALLTAPAACLQKPPVVVSPGSDASRARAPLTVANLHFDGIERLPDSVGLDYSAANLAARRVNGRLHFFLTGSEGHNVGGQQDRLGGHRSDGHGGARPGERASGQVGQGLGQRLQGPAVDGKYRRLTDHGAVLERRPSVLGYGDHYNVAGFHDPSIGAARLNDDGTFDQCGPWRTTEHSQKTRGWIVAIPEWLRARFGGATEAARQTRRALRIRRMARISRR